MQKRLGCFALIGLLLFTFGCAVDDRTSLAISAATGPATITTDKAAYNFGDSVTVTWAGLNGNVNDYIAIAPAGSALTTITRWAHTGGGATGTMVLEGPSTGGSYVARAFDNDTITLMGESDPITFAQATAGSAVVTPNKTSYNISEPITIGWTGLGGSAKDWISIAPVGSPDATTADWLYTGGGVSGSLTFTDGLLPTGYPPGNYVARAFLNDTFFKAGESAPFAIGTGGATVTTNKVAYVTSEAITVSWTGMPGNATDWIALVPTGSASTGVTTWIYSGGAVNGSVTFIQGLSATGSYVARAFIADSYQLGGESLAFSVGAATAVIVVTDKNAYTVGEANVVTWTGLPGNANDWIAIAPSGSPDTVVSRWVYAGGAANGSFAFESLVTPGTYVARAFLNDRYVKLGESAPFTLN